MIADLTVVPESQQCNYAEKIVYLPNAYPPADSSKPSPASLYSREHLGLPRDGFVFCCFNSVYKITPGMFDSWMRILNEAKGSVLWLAQANPGAMTNLRREAAHRGVAPERLMFASRIESLADHRARLGHADLFLDTFPYNAHVTALDALWAALPIVTRMGDAFAGRVAASLLTAINLPELITNTTAEYEELAVKLATTPAMMAGIREKLAANRRAAPLFNTVQFTQSLEAGYIREMQRYQEGLDPQHIYVADPAGALNRRKTE
jgi:predicted O-linked N-acetylglucosamine transferase (SPINDLY family)